MHEVSDKWILNYPDKGMASGTQFAGKEMSVVSPSFYAMMTPDSSNIEQLWLPKIWPNGKYTLTPSETASASTTVRSGDINYATWWSSEGETIMKSWDLSKRDSTQPK